MTESIINKILSEASVSITELKKNPMAVLEEGAGHSIAVLNRNRPVFYMVPAERYGKILAELGENELMKITHDHDCAGS